MYSGEGEFKLDFGTFRSFKAESALKSPHILSIRSAFKGVNTPDDAEQKRSDSEFFSLSDNFKNENDNFDQRQVLIQEDDADQEEL